MRRPEENLSINDKKSYVADFVDAINRDQPFMFGIVTEGTCDCETPGCPGGDSMHFRSAGMDDWDIASMIKNILISYPGARSHLALLLLDDMNGKNHTQPSPSKSTH